MTKQIKKYIVAAVVILVAILFYRHFSENHLYQQNMRFPPTLVLMTSATLQHWPDVIQTTGVVSAEQGAILRAQVAGTILKEYVDSSAVVKQGQLIYEIDSQGLSALVAQNKAELALRASQLQEQTALFKQGYVARNDFNVAQEAYHVALMTLHENQNKLALTQVTAPFAGHVGVPLVHEGDYVSVDQPLISLENPNNLRVDFSVPSLDAEKIHVGQKVAVTVSQYPNTTFHGTVTSVNTDVDQNSQSVLVRAHLDQPGTAVIAGSFAVVRLYVSDSQAVLAIPQTAIVYTDSGNAVYRVVKGIAHEVPVMLGDRLGNAIAVEGGLRAGDVIVSEGKVKLMDGMPVAESTISAH